MSLPDYQVSQTLPQGIYSGDSNSTFPLEIPLQIIYISPRDLPNTFPQWIPRFPLSSPYIFQEFCDLVQDVFPYKTNLSTSPIMGGAVQHRRMHFSINSETCKTSIWLLHLLQLGKFCWFVETAVGGIVRISSGLCWNQVQNYWIEIDNLQQPSHIKQSPDKSCKGVDRHWIKFIRPKCCPKWKSVPILTRKTLAYRWDRTAAIWQQLTIHPLVYNWGHIAIKLYSYICLYTYMAIWPSAIQL